MFPLTRANTKKVRPEMELDKKLMLVSQPFAVLSILANLLDVNRDGTSYSNELVHDTQANFTKQIDKIVSKHYRDFR